MSTLLGTTTLLMYRTDSLLLGVSFWSIVVKYWNVLLCIRTEKVSAGQIIQTHIKLLLNAPYSHKSIEKNETES